MSFCNSISQFLKLDEINLMFSRMAWLLPCHLFYLKKSAYGILVSIFFEKFTLTIKDISASPRKTNIAATKSPARPKGVHFSEYHMENSGLIFPDMSAILLIPGFQIKIFIRNKMDKKKLENVES